MYDDLFAQWDAIRDRVRQAPTRRLRLVLSRRLPRGFELIGAWSVHSQDAGVNWVGRVVFGSNFRLMAAFRGTIPSGEAVEQNFGAGFSYYADGRIVVVVDQPREVQINRITWIDRDRFLVTPQFGAPLTYDRVRVTGRSVGYALLASIQRASFRGRRRCLTPLRALSRTGTA